MNKSMMPKIWQNLQPGGTGIPWKIMAAAAGELSGSGALTTTIGRVGNKGYKYK